LLLLAWLGQLRRIGIAYRKTKTEVRIGTMRTDRSTTSGRVRRCADMAIDRLAFTSSLRSRGQHSQSHPSSSVKTAPERAACRTVLFLPPCLLWHLEAIGRQDRNRISRPVAKSVMAAENLGQFTPKQRAWRFQLRDSTA